jgi:glycosyltransferase involved in cell wall biosynthesis
MRVAIVGYPLLSRRQWGLYTEFPDADEIHLLTPREWPTAFESDFPAPTDPVKHHQHRSIFNGEMGRYLMPGILSTVRELDPDVVLTHGEPWHLNTLYTEFVCELTGIPHAIFSWENLQRMPEMRTQRLIERGLLPQIDGVIAGSQAATDRLQKIGYSGPIVKAPESGVDTEQFSPDQAVEEVQDRFGIPDGAMVILYTGRLVKEKGVELLIESTPGIIAECSDAHVLILGDGDRAAHIANRINALDVSDAVTLITDQQPYNEMPAIHSLASVFVYPSRTIDTWAEQFGFAVVEAMSCGVPVVTTECGALPYVVGDTGIVCPENNIEAIREAIIHLLSDDQRRRDLGHRARERAVTEFSLESVATKHRSLLNQIQQ